MNERQLLIDSIVAESAFYDPLFKNAEGGVLSSLVGIITDYVGSKIDPNNRVESVLSLLVPATFAALGGSFRILGFAMQIAESVFGISIGKIIMSIASEIKGLISTGAKVTSDQVNKITQQSVLNNGGGEATENEYSSYLRTNQSLTLSDALMFKKAADVYNTSLEKTAKLPGAGFATFLKFKGKSTSLLVALISIIVRTILWAGGFMLAEDGFNKLVGRPNSFDGSSDKRDPAKTISDSGMSPGVSNQKVFVVNSNYREENLNNKYNRWVINTPIENIDDVILGWSLEVYPDLKSHESQIKNTNNFQTIVNLIKTYNSNNNTGAVFIPPTFKSKKQIVDKFIDEVAQSSPSPSVPSVPTEKHILTV